MVSLSLVLILIKNFCVSGNFLKQSELRYKEEGEVFSVFDTERFGSFGENRREKFFSFKMEVVLLLYVFWLLG